MKRVLVIVAALAWAGCSKCGAGTTSAPRVERLLPRGAMVAVIVPSLEVFGAKLTLLQKLKAASFIAPTQGFADAKGFADALVANLGVDPRSKEALAQAGLDGARSLGVAALVTGQVVVVVPVADEAKFTAALQGLAQRRLGAGVRADKTEGGVVLVTFATAAGTPARLGAVFKSGFAVIAVDDGIAKLPSLVSMTETDSLASDTNLTSQLARVSSARDVFAYAPTGSPLLARTPATSVVAALSLSPTAFGVTLDAPLKDPSRWGPVLTAHAVPDLTTLLPNDAFVVLRSTAEPVAFAPFVNDVLGPYLTRAFGEKGFDVKTELLEQLKPGVFASLSVADRPPLASGVPELDVRKTNPFAFVHLAGVATAKSGEVVVPALEKIAEAAPRFGAQMKKLSRDDSVAFLTTYAQGEGVHFATKGDRVWFGSPVQRLDTLVRGTASGSGVALGPEAWAALIDLRALARSVKALPESAWGLGGFAMKATTVRWLDATDDLRSISIGLGVKDGAVQGQLTMNLTPAP
jgi:hypothetical protein